MFKRKAKQTIDLDLTYDDINLEQLVIGSFWSGKTFHKAESISNEELKLLTNEFQKIIHENTKLTQFKEVALKHITKDQLEAIEKEVERRELKSNKNLL